LLLVVVLVVQTWLVVVVLVAIELAQCFFLSERHRSRLVLEETP
jgi:hypothetical protein